MPDNRQTVIDDLLNSIKGWVNAEPPPPEEDPGPPIDEGPEELDDDAPPDYQEFGWEIDETVNRPEFQNMIPERQSKINLTLRRLGEHTYGIPGKYAQEMVDEAIARATAPPISNDEIKFFANKYGDFMRARGEMQQRRKEYKVQHGKLLLIPNPTPEIRRQITLEGMAFYKENEAFKKMTKDMNLQRRIVYARAAKFRLPDESRMIGRIFEMSEDSMDLVDAHINYIPTTVKPGGYSAPLPPKKR